MVTKTATKPKAAPKPTEAKSAPVAVQEAPCDECGALSTDLQSGVCLPCRA